MKPRLLLAATAALALLVAACGGAGPSPSASSGNKPTVLLQAPANGAVVAVGQNVTVMGAASDTVGVDHVALFADGVSFASTPSGQPAPLVPFSLTWLATPAGPHILQVIAYRADGTASDPAVANVVVGAGSFPAGSGVPFSFAPPSNGGGGLITPKPTKKPKPTETTSTATATPPPSTTTATPSPTPTPTPIPTPTRTPLPTKDASGNAPDDTSTEPHMIVLDPANAAGCPANSFGFPVAAVGCVWEQVSAPAGDTTDLLAYVPVANTSFQVQMTSCTDQSDVTEWFTPPKDQNTLLTGCGDWLNYQYAATAPAMSTIQVDLGTPSAQTYNLYQFTVWQCQFANCANQ